MSKQLLIETRMNSLSLLEGIQDKNSNCLGTLYGPCADYKNATRNNNFYSRKLWENVFSDPLVKESLEDRVLIGELDHPGDRLETKATNACIVMTDYNFDDDTGVVNGKFDILNTPNGKILRSLLDYGCKIGVSSRGEGDVVEDACGKNVIGEDSYYFVAFDAVVLPAVKTAKPTLQESLKRQNFKESLISQINSAANVSELKLIKKVLESINLPDIDSLYESIDNKSKELEGINNSSNLSEDLETSVRHIQELTEENKRLNSEVTNCKSRISKLVESRTKVLNSKSDKVKELRSLREEYNILVFNLNAVSKKTNRLESQLKECQSDKEVLDHQIKTLRESDRDHLQKISNLERLLKESQTNCQDYNNKINSLKESYSVEREKTVSQQQTSMKKERELQEQLNSLKDNLKKISKERQDLIENYVVTRSQELGIDSKRILDTIGNTKDFKKITEIINEEVSRSDRYRNIPRANRVVSQIGIGQFAVNSNEDVLEENLQTKSFMETFYNQN